MLISRVPGRVLVRLRRTDVVVVVLWAVGLSALVDVLVHFSAYSEGVQVRHTEEF